MAGRNPGLGVGLLGGILQWLRRGNGWSESDGERRTGLEVI